MGILHIGKCLRDLTCQHYSTATHTQSFGYPHPHVTSRTVCLDCGKSVSPRTRVPDDVIHEMLADAARKAKSQ